MTLFQQLLNRIESLKTDNQSHSAGWVKYRIQPLQEEMVEYSEFTKNFTNEDGTLCVTSIAMLFMQMREQDYRIEELETELREMRSKLND